MSWMKTLALSCDDCGDWDDFGIPLQPATAKEVRTVARKAGWVRLPRDSSLPYGADICPDCARKSGSA